MLVPIEVSARHVHLSESDTITLFGKNLNKFKDLSQPNQFMCEERVSIIGPKNQINKVAVLGPCRNKTQVEISLTDCIKLGINPDIRESGNLEETSGCEILGPNGRIVLKEGVIVAKRHIHIDELNAKKLNVINGQIVSVKIKSENRSLILQDVVLRVDENFSLAMHVDTDEANSFNFVPGIKGEIII